MEQLMQMSDGHVVFTKKYEPVDTCIGHIHILHGMAEHSGRYEQFARVLCAEGYVVTTHDHRGHGITAKRNGKLGFFAEQDGFHRVVEDVYEIVCKLHAPYQDVPFILFGHSMGSFIARRFIQVHGELVDRVILCGTGAVSTIHRIGHYVALSLAKQFGKDAESPLLNDLSFGHYNKQFPDAKTDFDWICSVDAVVQKFIEDPYCGFIPTNQFFVDLTQGMKELNKKTEIEKIKKNVPILLVSGTKDPVGEQGEGVYHVAEQYHSVGLEDVTVYLFEDMRHEILNEANQQMVYQVLLRWLNQYDR